MRLTKAKQKKKKKHTQHNTAQNPSEYETKEIHKTTNIGNCMFDVVFTVIVVFRSIHPAAPPAHPSIHRFDRSFMCLVIKVFGNFAP